MRQISPGHAKILDNGTFRVYVYANDDSPHHLAHCHVYWDGHDHASVVSLPDLALRQLRRRGRPFLVGLLDSVRADPARLFRGERWS